MLYFSRLKKEELEKYAILTRKELAAEEYFPPEVLLAEWDDIESFVLKNSDNEWIGWCAMSEKPNIVNPDGLDLLCVIVFPKFRNQGYSKYLYKIFFDKSIGKDKLVRISPFQDKMLEIAKKYGFKAHDTNRIWNTYTCCKECYPNELKKLELKQTF